MNLCNYCGACILVCPENAIEYGDATININESCTRCSKCLDICSQNQKTRYQTNLIEKENNEKIAEYYPPFKEIHIGSFIKLYNCKSKKEEVFEHSMVGGTTLSLLACALEEKLVDVVVVTDFAKKGQFPEAKIISEKKKLYRTGGSRYLPTLSLQVLEKIEKDETIKSVAITTLPCQAYMIKKLSMQTETKKLTRKIKYVLTLFCGSGLPSRKDVELFLMKRDIETDLSQIEVYSRKIKKIWRINPKAQRRYIYREQRGKKYEFSSSKILKSKTLPNCSSICPDYCGVHCDIAIGGSGIRRNIAVSRTEIGEKLIQKAMSKKLLTVKKRFSKLNRIVINFMGRRKRYEQRVFYTNHYID